MWNRIPPRARLALRRLAVATAVVVALFASIATTKYKPVRFETGEIVVPSEDLSDGYTESVRFCPPWGFPESEINREPTVFELTANLKGSSESVPIALSLEGASLHSEGTLRPSNQSVHLRIDASPDVTEAYGCSRWAHVSFGPPQSNSADVIVVWTMVITANVDYAGIDELGYIELGSGEIIRR